MIKKITEKEKLYLLMEVVENSTNENRDLLKEYILHRIEQVDKKRNYKSKALNNVNTELTKIILHELEYYKDGVTVSNLLKDSEMLKAYSYVEQGIEKPVTTQKLVALMKKVDNIEKIVDKKATLFRLKK